MYTYDVISKTGSTQYRNAAVGGLNHRNVHRK